MYTPKILAGAVPLGLMLGAATAIAADRPGLGKPVTEADLALWDGAGVPLASTSRLDSPD